MSGAVQAFPSRKVASGVAVLLLHLLVIAALLSTTQWTIHQVAEPKEIILNLITPKAPAKAEKKEAPATEPKPVREMAPSFVPPTPFTPRTQSPALNGLNRQLFGCAPDALASATQEERAACASASLGPRYDPGATDYRDHTDRSKEAVRWARGRARKNGPLLLPCANPQSIIETFGLGGLLCLAKAAKDGKFDPDMQPGYADKPPEGPPHLSPDAGQPFAPID